ncbi:MAG: CGNR zinc finger domain-containing protein [Ilumatobacteraceae bacterium]
MMIRRPDDVGNAGTDADQDAGRPPAEPTADPGDPGDRDGSTDHHGRVLIEPSWPSERAAPGELELVRRFCNSINRENGADHFADPRGVDRWLAAESRPPTNPSGSQLATLLAVREAFHDIVLANQDRAGASDGWAALASALTDTTFRLRADAAGIALSASSPSSTEALLGELALVVVRARDAGTLSRLIACASCEWMIYDGSKNRSARWCSAAVCGSRHNARAYRQRRRAQG